MAKNPDMDPQKMLRRMEMDAFAAKKGEVQKEELPFEQEGPGSPEDAAKLAEVIEDKYIMVEATDKMLGADVDELMDKIKKSDRQSAELNQHNLLHGNQHAEEVEKMLDLVDDKIAEIKRGPDAINASARERYLEKLRRRLAEKYDRFTAERKFRDEIIAEQKRTKSAEQQAAYQKEISEPSVIVNREIRTKRPERSIEPAPEDAMPPIYRIVDGKAINIEDEKKKQPGLGDRIKKFFGGK